MKTIEVFDPAMCCSTGVCGPAVDPDLARFAGDVEWLKEHGASVRRYNLSQEPMAFAQNAVVARALQDGGAAAATTACQVTGGWFGSRPAFSNASLL